MRKVCQLNFINYFVNCLLAGIMSLQLSGFMLHYMLDLLNFVTFLVCISVFLLHWTVPIVCNKLIPTRVMVRK